MPQLMIPGRLIAAGDDGVLVAGNLLNDATSYLGGVEPYHWADYINNRMLYAGADVGTVADGTGYSFTRASEGYYENSDGTLTNFVSGALRRGDRGVLIEGARTNLLLRSQEFDNASWATSSASVSANATTAPDDTTTADTFTASASAFGNVFQNITVTTNTAYTVSVFVKQGTSTRSAISFYDVTGVDHQGLVTFDWVSGIPATQSTSGSPTNITYQALANGWYRISFTATSDATNTAHRVILYPDRNAGTGTTIFWGAQLEAGSFPSSYIPTTSSSATRAGSEYLTATTSGLDSAVSMWSEIEFGATTSAVQTIAQFDDGTANNRLILRRNASGNAEMELITGGASQGIVTGGAMANNTTHKIACSATANALRLSLNGTSATPDTVATMPTGLANIRVGAGISIALPSFAYHSRFAMFNSALSAANLDLVTT
jgi:hypothetical protein